MIDKESLDLVKDAYEEAKRILMENKDKMIEFSQLLQDSIVLYSPE